MSSGDTAGRFAPMPANTLQRTATALRDAAMTYPEAHEDFPWGEVAIKVNNKVFLFMYSNGETLSLSCKLPQSSDMALMLPFAKPTGYGLGKSGWVSASFTGQEEPPFELLREWIDESYRAVAPKKLVAALAGAGGGEEAGKQTAKAGGEGKQAAKTAGAARPTAKSGGAAKKSTKAANTAGAAKVGGAAKKSTRAGGAARSATAGGTAAKSTGATRSEGGSTRTGGAGARSAKTGSTGAGSEAVNAGSRQGRGGVKPARVVVGKRR